MTPTEPAVVAPTKLMTVDEFWEFVNRPENEPRSLELRKGKVVELSRQPRIHGRVCVGVGFTLSEYADRVRTGYVVGNNAGTVLATDPATVVGPDVAYYTDANTFDEIHPRWGGEVPVLAVEVLSPSDDPTAVCEKVEEYLTNGVRLVWLVDYELRQVAVHRPNYPVAVFERTNDLVGGDDLPGFTCKVADFFRLPGERTTSST